MKTLFQHDAEVAFGAAVALPEYTAEEKELLEEASAVLSRAIEAGHFSDVAGGSSLARLHNSAERANALLPEGVVVVARETTLGPRLLVGLRGRL